MPSTTSGQKQSSISSPDEVVEEDAVGALATGVPGPEPPAREGAAVLLSGSVLRSPAEPDLSVWRVAGFKAGAARAGEEILVVLDKISKLLP